MTFIRLTRSGRKHRIGKTHILAAMDGATHVVHDGEAVIYIGEDDRGVELEIVVVPDNRHPGSQAIIHAMPTHYRSRT